MSKTLLHKEPSKALIIAAFAALYVIWGSTYLANLFVLRSLPPFIIAGLRFSIAGLLLYGWCLLQGEKRPSWNALIKSSFSGILMLFMGTGAVVWSEQYLPSGLAAIIVASVPLWFVILDKREWELYFSNFKIIIGLLIGFIGVLLLFVGKGSINFSGNRMNLISAIVLLGGSISWAIGSLYSKYKPVAVSTSVKAAIQMMAAGVASFLFSFVTGEQHRVVWHQVSGSSITALVYLILIGSIIGFISYIWLLSVRPPSIVGTYAYVNPIVAVFLGWLFVGEKISTQQFVALCIILFGVLLVNLTNFRSQKEKQKAAS